MTLLSTGSIRVHPLLRILVFRRFALPLGLMLLLLPARCQGQSEVQSGANETAAQGSQPSQPSDTISVTDFVGDEAIEERLKAIFEASQRVREMQLSSKSGIVTLQGEVQSEEHRTWAESVARRTEDVIAVINDLEVRGNLDIRASLDVVRSSLGRLWNDFLQRSPLLLASALVLLITLGAAKMTLWLVRRTLEPRGLRRGLKDLAYQLSSIAVWVVGVLLATIIAFPGMTPSKALTVLGLSSIAIGFAFKDIFENFFAGILILWRYPFDRGDYISCGDITGQVEHITIRNTMIRRLDGELAVVPNAYLFKNDVDVLTSQPQRRVRLTCGIAYGEDIDSARDVIRDAVQNCKTVQGSRTVDVFAKEFASSSVDFEVAWWTGAKPFDVRKSRDEVVTAIKRALDEATIEIPFPYRTLTFKDPSIFRGEAEQA